MNFFRSHGGRAELLADFCGSVVTRQREGGSVWGGGVGVGGDEGRGEKEREGEAMQEE